LAGRAELKIVTVMPMIHMYRQDIRQQLDWIWREKKRAAESGLQGAAAQLTGQSVDVQIALIEGTQVSQDILDIAASDGTDLIIIGHKGRKALQRFLLGSVTERIAHHAPCSVLSVRTCDEQAP
jgi:nucleotide-binding universal stress UspA family protein